MSQATNLPGLKPIVLTPQQLKPPPGSEPVGVADDGRVIWEGPIFDGNAWFQQNAVSDDGHRKSPRIGPDGEHVWRKNKATGEKITPSFNVKRSYSIRQFVMQDMGNGNAGPRPVPGLSDEEKSRREKQALVDTYMERLSRAAVEEGLTPDELVSSVMGGRSVVVPSDEVAALRAEVEALKADLKPEMPGEEVAITSETMEVAPTTKKKAAPRKKRAKKKAP